MFTNYHRKKRRNGENNRSIEKKKDMNLDKQEFDNILIIGVGLIGSSIAIALREKGLCKKIIGLDRNPIVKTKCEELNIVDDCKNSIEDINNYYKEAATYTNPGRSGKPSLAKVKGLDRLGYLIKDKFSYMPKTVFQVGCSDGYTLHRMKGFGAEEVKGIDLSQANCDMAREQYGIGVVRGDFENYDLGDQKFELLILTHVLEHLFEPVSVLKKCHNSSYVEIPPTDTIHRNSISFLNSRTSLYGLHSSADHIRQ